MAFASSASAFGMKSSSSSSAPAFGGSTPKPFPTSTTQPLGSTSSPFGAPALQPSGSTPTPFSVPASQPAGSNQNPFGTSQPPASSSIFGQTQNQFQGQNPTQTQNQPPSGDFFGQPQPAQQAQPPSGGLFGGASWGGGPSNAANMLAQPAQGGFGSWGLGNSQTQNQQQPPQQPSTGFGTGSFFANTGQQPSSQPHSGGLWGSGAAQSTGPSIFGQSVPAPTQSQQPVLLFTRSTKFNDLPEQVQKIFEFINTHIQGRIQISNDLKARSLGDEPTKGAELIRKVHNDLVNTMSNLQADKVVVEELKSKVDLSVQDTIITTRIIDGFRNPQQNGSYLKNHAGFPLQYFTRAVEEIRQKLQWFKSTIEQIEKRLASAQYQTHYNPQAITTSLQAQNATFISLAGRLAELDADVQKVKSAFRELWRAHTGSARDPFTEGDRLHGEDGGFWGGTGLPNLNKSR